MADKVEYFDNVTIGQFVLTGIPTKVYVGGRFLTITDPDDIEDTRFGYGMDEDGEMQSFDYRLVQQLLVGGETVTLDTFNKASEEEDGEGSEKDKEPEEKEDKKDDEGGEDEKEEEGGDANPFESIRLTQMAPFKVRMQEATKDEIDAEIEGAEASMDAAKAKTKAAQAAEKDAIKKAKEKIKAAKAQPIDEDHGRYTFGTGDIVRNKNKNCRHYGSVGIIVGISDLMDDLGQVATYKVMNNGPTYKQGDVLSKTLDQLEQYNG